MNRRNFFQGIAAGIGALIGHKYSPKVLDKRPNIPEGFMLIPIPRFCKGKWVRTIETTTFKDNCRSEIIIWGYEEDLSTDAKTDKTAD